MKVYQIAPEPLSLMMCYVIVTDNGKVIVIDGGRDGHGKKAAPYLPAAIRAILGVGPDGPFTVDAWFLTHAHTDHFYELAKMLTSYTSDSGYTIRNLYFDFPPIHNGWESIGGEGDYSLSEANELAKGLAVYAEANGLPDFDYERLNGRYINEDSVSRGLSFDVDGCRFEVLQTRSARDKIVNSTSVIIKMTCKDTSFLFLGDAYIDSGDRLLERYTPDYLTCDYLQMAHHGQNGVSKEFYLSVGATDAIRMWPSPSWVFNVNGRSPIKTDVTRSWLGLPEDPQTFADEGHLKTGRDFVSGLYPLYPADPTRVDDWTPEVLAAQLVYPPENR